MAFAYRDGVLHAEDLSLAAIAAAHGTPAWVYSSAVMRARVAALRAALAGLDVTLLYALKANSNQAVIATFAREGLGADIVSAGELARARAAGVAADKIVFAGVGKTASEMAAGLEAGILQFNVESEAELRALDAVARGMGRRAPVAFRINPDVDAATHAKITTGKSENKFGIEIDAARDLARAAKTMTGIALEGIAVHIGSQLTQVAPYRAAFARVADFARELLADGHALRRLDLGGGLGVVYDRARDQAPDLAAYAAAIRDTVAPLGLGLLVEPGRWLVADAGLLLARVVYVKQGTAKRFVIVDAAMNDLLRPTLYEATHEILPVVQATGAGAVADLVGPVCESGDYLARGRLLPAAGAGDLVALMQAGAYGAVMSSRYNSRPLAVELLVRGHEVAVVRPRETIAALIAQDRLAPWL